MPVMLHQPLSTFSLDRAGGANSTSVIDTYLGRATATKRTNMSVAVVHMRADEALQEHYHRHTEETFLVTEGACFAVVDGEEYYLPKGALIVIQSEERHYLKTLLQQEAQIVAISLPAHDDADFIAV